jgi:uncharacterized membrane protein
VLPGKSDLVKISLIVLTATAQRIEIAPNCSLTVRGAALFFASLCGVSFAIAGLFAWRGAWPVLPFAGLEMLLLGWALRASLRRRFQLEIITLTEREVGIEMRDGLQRRAAVFPRHWARVKLRAARTPLHPSSLTIESHGRACEVGAFLSEEERRGLAARLKRLIGRVDESPPLRSQD